MLALRRVGGLQEIANSAQLSQQHLEQNERRCLAGGSIASGRHAGRWWYYCGYLHCFRYILARRAYSTGEVLVGSELGGAGQPCRQGVYQAGAILNG